MILNRPVAEIVFILSLGFLPSLLSIWLMRRAQTQAQESLQAALTAAAMVGLPRSGNTLAEDPEWRPQWVGDVSCRYNARSPLLRCAVNPCGPCQGCRHYQPR